MNIGEKLREARLQQNITLDELQQITKIQKRYLMAIEENDFDAMPGTFYVRAFIRQYANAVGLDGNDLVDIFDGKDRKKPIEEAVQFETLDASRTQMYDEEEGSAWIKNLPAIVFSLIGMAILIVVLYISWQNRQDNPIIETPASEISRVSTSTSESSETSTSSSSETSTSQSSSSSEPKPKAEVTYVSELNGAVEMNAVNVSSPAKATFTATPAACWVGIYIPTATNADNGYFFQETIQPGQPKTVDIPEGTTQIIVTFGASENIEFKLDDQLVAFNPNNTGIGFRRIDLAIAYANQTQTSQPEVSQEPAQ
ncbi:helix-turn-helix domain-containing protein [Enterococcus sp. LJL99]